MDGVEGWVNIAWNYDSILLINNSYINGSTWIESHALIGYPSG